MVKKQAINLMILLLVVAWAPLAHAGDLQPYSDTAFKQAQKEGKPILIDFHATWCGTCKAQQPVLKSLLSTDQFKSFVAFQADYDATKDLQKRMGVTGQSTIIIYKGEEEKARARGLTSKDELRDLLLQANF